MRAVAEPRREEEAAVRAVAEPRREEVQAVPVAAASAVPLAAAWVSRRGRPRPAAVAAPRPAARSEHEMLRLQTASRSKQSSQAVQGVVWSWRSRFQESLCDKAAGINKQALGRNVAAFKCQFGFISGFSTSKRVAVHCVFRRTFQTVPLLGQHACFRLSHAYRRSLRRSQDWACSAHAVHASCRCSWLGSRIAPLSRSRER